MLKRKLFINFLTVLLLATIACAGGTRALPTRVPTAISANSVNIPATYTPFQATVGIPHLSTVEPVGQFAPTPPATLAQPTQTEATAPPITEQPDYPYQLVDSLLADGWEIRVHEATTLGQLQNISGGYEYPQGRFLLLVLSVTNRRGRVDSFVSSGILDLKDEYRREYEDDLLASFYAAETYGIRDILLDVEVNQSQQSITVFDIPPQGDIFFLTKGILADLYGEDNSAISIRLSSYSGDLPTPNPTEILPPIPTFPPIPTIPGGGGGNDGDYNSGCCRVCTKGKACGNSCINAGYTCHQPPGCACNASVNLPVAKLFNPILDLTSSEFESHICIVPEPNG